MSNNIIPSIQTLPAEILHRIFDDLDAETILLSIRVLSRSFQSIVNTYNRYVLNFKLISKLNLNVLCRLINPGNVISLILSNDEQTTDKIDLFLSFAFLRKFTRLHSLSLLDIDESQLDFILKHINCKSLTSLMLRVRKHDDRRRRTTTNLLSSTIIKSTIRVLDIDIKMKRLLKVALPITSTIQYLTIKNHITMDELCEILSCSPHLHTLTINRYFDKLIFNSTPTFPPLECFRRLKSLTIDIFEVTIDELESFLLLTSSLVYLKLIGELSVLDGQRWEQFIGINLSYLDKFEFFFEECSLIKKSLAEIESIFSLFRTSFWIKHKQWFTACQYNTYDATIIYLYSIPLCISHLSYDPMLKNILIPTCTTTREDDPTRRNCIKSLKLSLSRLLADDIQEKVCYKMKIMYLTD